MNILEIIEKKRYGNQLSKEEIKYFVDNYVNGEIKDYQASALLMAICINGMTDDEAFYLTDSMLHSGDIVDLSSISGIKVDKHSTGGVGDKTTLVVGPIVASLGIKLAKMSGRGLGHTGGTLDKLESINGFNVNMELDDIIKNVNNINMVVVGQTKSLVPADKLLYQLRDATSTVSSIPLIASSIMSKKLASGADILVLDVKVGSGAFMKNIDDAEKLARLMVEIGKKTNKKVSAIITDMDNPLGNAIGNSVEVIEAINTLCDKGPKDFLELCLNVAGLIIKNAGLSKDLNEAKNIAYEQIKNHKAYEKFLEFVNAQGGEIDQIKNLDFKKPKYIIEIKSNVSGYISSLNALKLGKASMYLGAGRIKKEDNVDHSAGIVLNKKINDYVNKGDILAYLYTNIENINDIYDMVLNSFEFSKNEVAYKLIKCIVE